MTDKERKSLMKEIENCRKWMIDTSGYSEEDLTVADLIEDVGDIYEAFVVIHLINGECITLRNHCYRSFMIKMYSGDFLNSDCSRYNYMLRDLPTYYSYVVLRYCIGSFIYICSVFHSFLAKGIII